MAERLVRGAAVAERLVRGTAMAELLLAGNRRHRGLPAGAPWQSKGAVNAQAPLRGSGAGRKQELGRGVRS